MTATKLFQSIGKPVYRFLFFLLSIRHSLFTITRFLLSVFIHQPLSLIYSQLLPRRHLLLSLPQFFLYLSGKAILKVFLLLFRLFSFILYFIIIRIIRLFNLKIPQFFKFLKFPKLPKFLFRIINRHLKFAFCILSFICLSIISLLAYLLILKNLPSPHQLITRQPILTTKIYDRYENLLYKIYRSQNRTLVPLNKIPQHLINATIAIEDAEFYHHTGFSLKGIFRALRRYFTNSRLEGGSTITQQLVKNALLSPERTWTRKIKEIILAIETEFAFSKNEILQMYLNEVGYGGAAYGIEEASQLYFQKHVWEINLPESSLLAGLPASPTTYSPFGAHPELAIQRQQLVLQRMAEEGFINRNEQQQAINQPLQFASPKTDILAPHFVLYIKQLLVNQFGEQMVEEGGLQVTTTLDLNIQKMLENEIKKGVARQKYLRVSNAAALVLNPQTGEILAMVGSKDYFDKTIDGNVNVILRPRQPGSAIKIINYAAALERGYTHKSIIDDSPVAYKIPGQPIYAPKNYDGRFHGKVTLRQALASSLNVPAVKVLASYGVNAMRQLGQKMGITTWDDPSRFGLALTLGGGEVTMLDLATAYNVLANNGLHIPPSPFIKIQNSLSKTIYQLPTTNYQLPVISPSTAQTLTDILSDNHARSLTFGPNSPLNIPGVAVKTGTTDTNRDNWTIGYTKNFLVAVWLGNNDNTPMSPYLESGNTGAAAIWRPIILNLLTNNY